MAPLDLLAERLIRLDGRGYNSYKEIKGWYQAGHFRLVIDHVQGDPFAERGAPNAGAKPDQANHVTCRAGTTDE